MTLKENERQQKELAKRERAERKLRVLAAAHKSGHDRAVLQPGYTNSDDEDDHKERVDKMDKGQKKQVKKDHKKDIGRRLDADIDRM